MTGTSLLSCIPTQQLLRGSRPPLNSKQSFKLHLLVALPSTSFQFSKTHNHYFRHAFPLKIWSSSAPIAGFSYPCFLPRSGYLPRPSRFTKHPSRFLPLLYLQRPGSLSKYWETLPLLRHWRGYSSLLQYPICSIVCPIHYQF